MKLFKDIDPKGLKNKKRDVPGKPIKTDFVLENAKNKYNY